MEPTTGGIPEEAKPDPGGPYAAATLDQVCLALWGISERLDEHNRLTAAHTELLRQSADAAVTREAEAIKRDMERLKLLTVSRDGVLDEVQNALDDEEMLAVDGSIGMFRQVIDRLRTGEEG